MINRMGYDGKLFTLRRRGVAGDAGIVKLDDLVPGGDGKKYAVKGGAAPTAPNKSGYVEIAPEEGGPSRTLYTHVFNLEWVHNAGTGAQA